MIHPDWLFKIPEHKVPMKAAKLNPLDRMPSNIIFFPNQAGLSHRMASQAPAVKRRSKSFPTEMAKARGHRQVEDPIAQSRLAELFAMRRDEKAPENFIRDALEVLHRHNAISSSLALVGKIS